MSNVLDLVDQAAFAAERASGTTNLLQCVWVYDRAIDIEGMRRFHHHLRRGRLSRRIERSPLPFGRHRWISAADHSGLEIVESARPRAEFDTWLSEQAATRLDAERGPGWHLAVLPFTGDGAGVSLVISHSLTDGVGLCEALADAAAGRPDPIQWPAPGSRPRWRTLREDARQTARDIPAMGRAIAVATRFARRVGPSSGPTRPSFVATAESVTPPRAIVFVDAAEWDARACLLGGSGNALLVGFASRLAQRLGRVAPDGSATLAVPVNERTDDDRRANAITAIDIVVDPERAAADLREIRSAIKQALTRRNVVPDERLALLPLTPLLPQWLTRRMIGVALGGDTTSGSSNLGAVNLAANRPDGSDADYFAMSSLVPVVTEATMHHTGGLLGLLSGRVQGRVFVSIVAYQPGRPNSNDELRQHISHVLNDFSLAATVDWPHPQPATTAR